MEQSTKLCECGCGASVRNRFVSGHNSTHRVLSESDYRIEDCGYTSDCWLWLHQSYGGYGKVTIRKRRKWAHIAMWEQTHGPVPDGLELDHLCRTPSCIRPAHLEPVSHRENLRRGKGTRVTPEILSEIFRLRSVGLSHRKIAKKVGIGKTSVGDILNGHRWDH